MSETATRLSYTVIPKNPKRPWVRSIKTSLPIEFACYAPNDILWEMSMRILKQFLLSLLVVYSSVSLSAEHQVLFDNTDEEENPCCVTCCAKSLALQKAFWTYKKTKEPYICCCCEVDVSFCCCAKVGWLCCSGACMAAGAFGGCMAAKCDCCNDEALKTALGISWPMGSVPLPLCFAYYWAGTCCATTDDNKFLNQVNQYNIEYNEGFDACHAYLAKDSPYAQYNPVNCTASGPNICQNCCKIILKPCNGTTRRANNEITHVVQ